MAVLGKRNLTITIDGIERAAEVSAASIEAKEAESGTVTFANAAAGGSREYSLKLTLLQNPSAASLWDEIWSNAGNDVAVVLHPAGGPAGANKPTFTGTVTITEPDGTILGGEASTSATERYVTEVEWVYTAKPVRTFA